LKTDAHQEINQLISGYQFNDALRVVNDMVSLADKLIDKDKPWILIKTDKEKTIEILSAIVGRILSVSEALKPFLPETSEKIEKIFTAKKIKKPAESLFPRI